MLLALLTGCFAGLNPKAIPTQEIYVDDGQERAFKGAVSFAVVGDSREAFPGDRAVGRVPVAGAEAAIVADIAKAVQSEGLEFVALTGNMVAGSTTLGWKTFAKDWNPVLAGSELSETGGVRVRVVPAAGVNDREGDPRLEGWGAAFPGAGADIGYNRIASWYHFDLKSRGKTWRVLVLDSDKQNLGSRWDEQMAWVPKVLDGGYDSVIVLMNQPLLTLANKHEPNEGGGPKELLAAVEDATPVGAVKVVFSGQSGANEAFLPGGRYGEMYVNALSGAPASTLSRWGHAKEVGYEDLRLESMYDLALIRSFDTWAQAKSFPEPVIDHAKARGSYEGFVGEYDASYFPVQGWWNVTLAGDQLTLTLRALGPDGGLSDLYTTRLAGKDGWQIGG